MTESFPEPIDVGPAVGGHLRITAAERQDAHALLRAALADGRLVKPEHDQRQSLVQQALIRDDLTPLLRDLTPVPGVGRAIVPTNPTPLAPNSAGKSGFIPAILSTVRRETAWSPGSELTALAVLGEAKLDYSQAEWPDRSSAVPELTVKAFSVLGTVRIKVPADVEVRIDQTWPILGEVKIKGQSNTPKTRVLKIAGLALLGEIIVQPS